MINLGSKRGNAGISTERRLEALESFVRRIPARTRDVAVPESRTLKQTAHGFVVGQPISRSGSAWSAAGVGIGGSGPINSRIGLVTCVLDANTFVVVFQGLTQMPAAAFTPTAWTTYYLPTTAAAPWVTSSPTGLVAGVAKRAVFIAMDNGWVYVIGSEVEQHDHRIQDARDIDRTVTPSDGNILAYQLSDGSMKWTTVLASFGSRAATSVVGNATGASAAATDIAATADGQVLQRASGALAWALIGSASIAAGAVLAASLGSDVKLTALKDVSIASQVANDVPMFDGTNWVRRNLGPMAYSVVASFGNQLSLDGPTGGTAINVGLAVTGSRLVLGGSSMSFDVWLSGNIGLGSDRVARLKSLGSTGVGFYDQARGLPDGSTTGAAAGTEVMEWGCSATPTSRYFRFMVDAQFQDTGTKRLTIHGQATGTWRITDDSAGTYLDFIQSDATDGLLKVKALTSIDLGGNSLYVNGGSGPAISGTSSALSMFGATVTISATSIVLTAPGAGSVRIGASGGSIGFFSGTPASKTSVSAPSSGTVTGSAGTSYTSTEQAMINALKLDMSNLRTTVAALQTALSSYSLV